MTALALLVAALLVTGVHEAGHLLFARARAARVLAVRVGYGPRVATFQAGTTEYVLAVLPLGGRVRCERLASEAANAVIALGGPVTNAVFGVLLLMVGGWWFQVEGMPGGVAGTSTAVYAVESLGYWSALIPRLVASWIGSGPPGQGGAALAFLGDTVLYWGIAGKLYFLAALSILWGMLNLIPLPLVNTDGWHVAAAGARALRRTANE